MGPGWGVCSSSCKPCLSLRSHWRRALRRRKGRRARFHARSRTRMARSCRGSRSPVDIHTQGEPKRLAGLHLRSHLIEISSTRTSPLIPLTVIATSMVDAWSATNDPKRATSGIQPRPNTSIVSPMLYKRCPFVEMQLAPASSAAGRRFSLAPPPSQSPPTSPSSRITSARRSCTLPSPTGGVSSRRSFCYSARRASGAPVSAFTASTWNKALPTRLPLRLQLAATHEAALPVYKGTSSPD